MRRRLAAVAVVGLLVVAAAPDARGAERVLGEPALRRGAPPAQDPFAPILRQAPAAGLALGSDLVSAQRSDLGAAGVPTSPAPRPGGSRPYGCAKARGGCQPNCGWRHEVSIPLWVPGVTGTLATGNLEVGADGGATGIDLGDAVDSGLQFAFVGSYRAQYRRWVLYADAFGVRVRGSTRFEFRDGRPADASLGAFVARLVGGYRLIEHSFRTPWCTTSCLTLDAYAGARFYHARVRILDAKESRLWVDPIVGFHTETALTQDVSFLLNADVGGFGIGSEFAWSATAAVKWYFNHWGAVALGYSFLDVDFVRTVGPATFRFDIRLQGPQLVLSFRF